MLVREELPPPGPLPPVHGGTPGRVTPASAPCESRIIPSAGDLGHVPVASLRKEDVLPVARAGSDGAAVSRWREGGAQEEEVLHELACVSSSRAGVCKCIQRSCALNGCAFHGCLCSTVLAGGCHDPLRTPVITDSDLPSAQGPAPARRRCPRPLAAPHGGLREEFHPCRGGERGLPRHSG